MIFNEEFLSLIPGSIGEVVYIKKIENKISKKNQEEFVDRFVNARLNAMVMKHQYGMEGGETPDPQLEFSNAREMARQELENGRPGTKNESLYLQVNQKESYDSILKAEEDPDFVNWTFPEFIRIFKESYLKSTE